MVIRGAGFGAPDGMRIEGMGNLSGYEGWGISGEEELGEIGCVGVEVIMVAADSLPLGWPKRRG